MRSQRLDRLPPYLFVEIDKAKESYRTSGREMLDLGIGDPDLGAPPELIASLRTALDHSGCHRYPPARGLPRLIEAVKSWAFRRYGLSLDSEEVLITSG